MSKDLNEQYFETRKRHNLSYIRKGYVIWILFGIGILSFFVGREFIGRRRHESLKEAKTREFLEQGILSKTDTIVISKLTGTRILILKGFLYKELESEFGSTFVAVKNDSSGLGYFTTRIIPTPEYKSSMEQWKKYLISTGSSYEFSDIKMDSVNGLRVETANIEIETPGQKPMKGKAKIIKKGGLYYVLQIYAFVGQWDRSIEQTTSVENSFEIVE